MGIRPSAEVNDNDGTILAVDRIGRVYADVKKVADKIDDLMIVAENADTIVNSVETSAANAAASEVQANEASDSADAAAASAASAAQSALDAEAYTALSVPLAQKGVADGVMPLGPDGKAPTIHLPDAILGAMKFQATWDAAANTPAIPLAAEANRGHYYVVSAAGTTSIDGEADWNIGDWIVSNGTGWAKIDNSDKVSSVAGKTGAVALVKNDVGLGNVDNTSDANKPVSVAQQTALDAKASLAALAADTGFTLIKHKVAGVGAYARTAAQMLRVGALGNPANVFHFIDPDLDDDILAGTNLIDLGPYFKAAMEANMGREIYIPKSEFLIATAINPLLTDSLRIEFEAGARLIAAAGMDEPVLNIKGAAANQALWNNYELSIINPYVDCSAGVSTGGAQLCTAIAFDYVRKAYIEGGYLYGGEEPDNLNADCGITWVTCDDVTVMGTTFRGFNDAGIYPGGNNDPDADGDGGSGKVIGCTFQRCQHVISAKRQMKHLQVLGGVVEECVAGIMTSTITDPVNLTPLRRLDVKGVKFHKIRSRAIGVTSGTKLTMKDCEVEDWGYDYDGTNSAGADALAVSLLGTSGADFSNNSFKMNEWALDDQRVFQFNNVTFDGVTYTHGSCFGSGNSYRNIPKVFVWASAGNAHTFLNEYFEGITVEKIGAANVHTDTEVTFKEYGKHGLWHQKGSVLSHLGPKRVIAKPASATISVDENGSVFNTDGAAGAVVLTLPPAAVGLEFTFMVTTPVSLTIDAAVGDFIRIPGGTASTSGGTLATSTRGNFITIKAVDVNNWMAISYGGTWTAA